MEQPRVGTVLVFKEGMTKEQAERLLTKIRDVIDDEYYVSGMPTVHEFDSKWGGPVWYIP